MLRSIICCLLAAILFFPACTSDELPEPMEPTASGCDGESFTYEADVRPIIEQSCAYSGCHLGSAPGRFDTFDGLLPFLQNGKFRERVIVQRANPNVGMPPDYAPDDRPQDLTAEQLELVTCWLEDGFPRQ